MHMHVDNMDCFLVPCRDTTNLEVQVARYIPTLWLPIPSFILVIIQTSAIEESDLPLSMMCLLLEVITQLDLTQGTH